ncbi:hypothetical protein ALQ54_04366 [Pseudomonas syringae]|nr:Unknown protein sequence [Pseudomonas syringae pv. syringae]KPZ01650.1 Unknown protein sequence [Pseudomonas syringae pv. aptata]RMN71603.1 hypothetical protein ALQ54_04366 [Pseudomonas syringae]
MIGGTLSIKHVRAHRDEILRLVTSINGSKQRNQPNRGYAETSVSGE